MFDARRGLSQIWLRALTDNRPRGPMDKASAYGAGDCRFESCRGHLLMRLTVLGHLSPQSQHYVEGPSLTGVAAHSIFVYLILMGHFRWVPSIA